MFYVSCGQFKVSIEVSRGVKDEEDRRLMVSICAVPDRLLVLLVLFAVDDLYPTFPGPRTP